MRTRLPETRRSVTRKATICGFKTYITVGFFDDGAPGEVFVKLSKHGGEISGLMDTVATFISIGLQYGVPWEIMAAKLRHTRFGQSDENHSSLCDGLASHITEIAT